MKYASMSIKKAIQMIDDKELLLPHIQRPFVWKQDKNNNQVKRFFDTIMRGYPFGTLLFWITKDDVKVRKFIDNYRDNMDISNAFLKSAEFRDKKKMLVLDGQQRLQALYIALKGTYNNKELYFNILSGNKLFLNGQDEMKYDFDYFTRKEIKELNSRKRVEPSYWVLLKDIVLSNEPHVQIKKRILSEMKKLIEINDFIEDVVDSNVSVIKNMFSELELIYYYPIDSTVGKITDYEEILEIFIRTNSGGTILTKSDLMFSLIKLGWTEAEEEFERLLNSINQNGTFRFNKDFILKTALVTIKRRARYEVRKFKGKEGEKNLRAIRNNWENIRKSFYWLIDFLIDARITSDGALPSYNTLIPIIYYAYICNCKPIHHITKYNIKIWLYKALLNGNFSGQSDRVIDACTDIIDKSASIDYFPFYEIEQEIKNKFNRVVDVNPNIIDGNPYLVLNIAYLFNNEINFQPLLSGNSPEIDHIFPKSIMLGKKYRVDSHLVNNIGNYMFLEKTLNIYKTNKLPQYYFREAKINKLDFFKRNFIPEDSRLHRPENFEKFVNKRRDMIYEILKQVLKYQYDSEKTEILEPVREEETKLKEWTEEEIYDYLDFLKEYREWTYYYFKVLAQAQGKIRWEELVKSIKQISNGRFTGRKFAGVQAGIAMRTTSKGRERLDWKSDDGWEYSLNPKYIKEIKKHFEQTE